MNVHERAAEVVIAGAPAPSPVAVDHGTMPMPAATIDTPRARILRATVDVLAERGYGRSSAALVIARARVSRRTFARSFDGLDHCVGEVLLTTGQHASLLAAEAFRREDSWQDGMRGALASVLLFFDSEPELARVCMVEALAAGPGVLDYRERATAAFRSAIVSQIGGRASRSWPLAAEAILGSVILIVRERLVTSEAEPLIELLGPLMATIIAPFADEPAIARELRRDRRLVRALTAAPLPAACRRDAWLGLNSPIAALGGAAAGRARDCLLYLREHPDASNREIAAGIGVGHQSQISRLLSALAERNLIAKRSSGTGKRNSSRLTLDGEAAVAALSGGPGTERLAQNGSGKAPFRPLA